MTLYTRDDERQYAEKLITSDINVNQANLTEAIAQVKFFKKNLRKLNKQVVCNHEFKLKQTVSLDEYTCKTCKFKFKYSAYLEKNTEIK